MSLGNLIPNSIVEPTMDETVIERVIDEAVLTPIAGPNPAGVDIRGLKQWVELKNARPKLDNFASDPNWQQANPVRTDWPTYRDLVEKTICRTSKDLELGTFLTEAGTRVFGFSGARDGLWMIGGLISIFLHQGLHPRPEDGDIELQYGKLDWLNEKFSEVLCEIPITFSAESAENYSLNYYRESRRPGGMISATDFDKAASESNIEVYTSLLEAIRQTRGELIRLKQIAAEAYGDGALSFTFTDDVLNEFQGVVQSILHKRSGNGQGDASKIPPDGVHVVAINRPPLTANSVITPTTDAWNQAEQLARSGSVADALASMAALAAAEPNGRIRFQRKLLLADLCMQTNRKKLATSILQELNEIIETHKLETWETSEMVGSVWSRLVQCYRDKAAGTDDENREAEFFLKLSRLDPWQALACGEPVKRDNA